MYFLPKNEENGQGLVALLPFLIFTVPKPIVGMPKELITLGDNIKKKRLESNKTQKNVGEIIGLIILL